MIMQQIRLLWNRIYAKWTLLPESYSNELVYVTRSNTREQNKKHLGQQSPAQHRTYKYDCLVTQFDVLPNLYTETCFFVKYVVANTAILPSSPCTNILKMSVTEINVGFRKLGFIVDSQNKFCTKMGKRVLELSPQHKAGNKNLGQHSAKNF